MMPNKREISELSNPEIETNRLAMRPFKITDVDDFSVICADKVVMQYIGGGVHDKKETRRKIYRWIDAYKRDGFGLMALHFKATNQLIGFCGLIRQEIDGRQYIELGYRLARSFWQQGLATEAALAVRDYAFIQLQLPELIAIIHQENYASKSVAKKIGMKLFLSTHYCDLAVDIFRLKKDNTNDND